MTIHTNTTVQPNVHSIPVSTEMPVQQERTLEREESVVTQNRVPEEEERTTRDVAFQLETHAKESGGDFASVLERFSRGALSPEDEAIEDDDESFELAKRGIVDYLSTELEDDQVYKEKLGEVASEMIAKGKELDPEVLREEALRRYLDTTIEEDEELSFNEQMALIEDKYSEILSENPELKQAFTDLRSTTQLQAETIQVLALSLLEIARKLREEEEEEEKKISWLELMFQLVALFLKEMTKYEQNGQQQNQPDTQDVERKARKRSPITLPNISLPKLGTKMNSRTQGVLQEDTLQELPKAA